jgi:hypothetical protein
MDLNLRKKDTQLSWFDLAVFAAVAAFFLFSAHSLSRSASAEHLAGEKGGKTLPDRTLASSPAPAPSRGLAGTGHGIQVVRMDCLFTASPGTVTTDAKMVQIMSNLCGELKSLPKDIRLTGKNQSSGEDIVPFLQAGHAVTTNYFTLREGRNEVLFRLALGRGKELRQNIVFVRTPRATE